MSTSVLKTVQTLISNWNRDRGEQKEFELIELEVEKLDIPDEDKVFLSEALVEIYNTIKNNN